MDKKKKKKKMKEGRREKDRKLNDGRSLSNSVTNFRFGEDKKTCTEDFSEQDKNELVPTFSHWCNHKEKVVRRESRFVGN